MCGCRKMMTRACREAAPCLRGGEGDVGAGERGRKGGKGEGWRGRGREVLHVWMPQDDDQGMQGGRPMSARR